MELRYAIAPFSEYPIFQINQHIGWDNEDGMGIDGKCFSREVFEVDSMNPKCITFYINSLGGCVENGNDMFSAILACKSDTESINAGWAFSTAGWLLLAAKRVKAYDYSLWMAHLPYATKGDETETIVSKASDSIALRISANSGKNGKPKKSVEDIKALMSSTTYWTAQEMYDAGLIDEILPSGDYKIETTKEETSIKNYYKKQQKVFNKFIANNFKTEYMYPKVINRLKLRDDATENEIVNSIADIEESLRISNKEKESFKTQLTEKDTAYATIMNKVTQHETKISELNVTITNKETEITNRDTKITTLEAKVKELEDSIEVVNKEKKDAQDAALKLEVQNYLNPFVASGKIKEENLPTYEKMGIENLANLKAIVDLIPTNMHTPIVTSTKLDNKNAIDLGDGSDEAFRLANKAKREAANK